MAKTIKITTDNKISREMIIEQLKMLAKDYEALDQVIELLEGEVTGNGATELIQNAIDAEGINQRILADRMGMPRQNINQMLKRGKNSMRYDNFEKLAKTLGYEVVLRKNSAFEK